MLGSGGSWNGTWGLVRIDIGLLRICRREYIVNFLFLVTNWRGADHSSAIQKAHPPCWSEVSLLAVPRFPLPLAVQAPICIMRLGRKSKTVDTARAQSLAKVREPNHGSTPGIADGPSRFLLSFAAQAAKPASASTSTSAPSSPAIVTGGRLPLELYGYIISLVDSPSALRQLCLVCQFFCNEGRRRLYNTVDLPMRRISPFAWTVANHPHIARRVRSISITLPSHMVSMNNGEGKDIVAIVLRSLTELENLDIYGQPRIQLQKLLDVTNPRLKRFRSSAFLCQEVIDSLALKPQLRELVTPESYPHFHPIVPESFLPRLETLCLPICLVHHVTKMSWALTHLAIDLSPYRDLESLVPGIVSHFGDTLANLSLVRLVPAQAYRLCPMIDLISEFAANVPKLRFLTVSVCEIFVGLKHPCGIRITPPADAPAL